MGPVRIAVAAVVVLVLLVGVGGVLLYDGMRSEQVAEGVQVGDVDVGGRSVPEARRLVRERIAQPARRDVVVRHGEGTWELSADQAGVEVDVEATVEAAVDAGRADNPWSRTWRALTGGSVDATVEPRLRLDEEAVGAFVKRVADDLDHRPTNADIDPNGGELTVIEHDVGWRTDREALLSRVTDALRDPHAEREFEAPGKQLEPETTVGELRESVPLYLIVDRDEFRLRVYEHLEKDGVYAIGVGRAGHETPSGSYDISTKAKNPAWHVPDEPWAGDKRGEVIPPGDPDNPLKARWLGIEDGVGIHGTAATGSIGERASHGCIRMRVPDVKELYARVPVGTPVYID